MKCFNCGSEISNDSKFCNSCGSKINNQNKFCANCGNELDSQSDYCVKCGSKVLKDNIVNADDEKAINYLIGALVSFFLPGILSIFNYIGIPLSYLNFLSPVGVLTFLIMGMKKYPDKKYFKILLIVYIILSVAILLLMMFTIILFLQACVESASNCPG